jgi:hypothetical protein
MKQTFDLFATESPDEKSHEESASMNGGIGLLQTQLRLEGSDFDFSEPAKAFPLDPTLRRPA